MYKKLTDLSGKRALVTGGGRGIGLCAADALAEAGACVVIVDLSDQLLEEGLAFLRSKGHEVEGLVLDVSDSDATERVAEEVETKSGPMDIMIANAGISGPDTPAENLTDEAWHRIMKVNLDGVFWSCRALANGCWNGDRERSLPSDRCLGSFPTSLRNRWTTTPPRPRCIT